jgi:hypothetical protein
MEKGITLVSGVIFLALTISAAIIVYNAGMPLIEKMQDVATIEKMKIAFTQLDKIIQEVASEGKGSKRSIYLTLDPGKFVVDGTKDIIYWKFNTPVLIISPRTFQLLGNLIVGSNLETAAYEGNYSGTPAYVLENEYLRVYIKKIGSPTNHTSYNTSQLLLGVYQKDLNTYMPLESLDISIDDRESSRTGTGYTILERKGSNLPYGIVTAYINSSYMDYYIRFILESGGDFLEIEGGVQ